jgi:hypothetical protein
MLETWEAAVKFAEPRKNAQPTEIAKILGWVELKNGKPQINHTARACHSATSLMQNGYTTHQEPHG